MGKKQSRLFKDTRLGKLWLLKFLFVSIPSISDSEPRWASFQVTLSLVFFFVAAAISIAAIDISKVGGAAMIAVWLLLGLALLPLSYAIGMGIYWAKKDSREVTKDSGLHETIMALVKSIDKSAETASRSTETTHNVIQSLVNEMRQDRDE